MTARTLRADALVALASILLAAALVAAAPAAADAQPRLVGLSDAYVSPSWLTLVLPSRYVDVPADRLGRNCAARDTGRRTYFTDVHAYRWDGAPLAVQGWDASLPGHVWDPPGRGAVGFDGVTFYNGTSRAVLVAGWCDDNARTLDRRARRWFHTGHDRLPLHQAEHPLRDSRR